VAENAIMIDGIRAWTAQVDEVRLVAAAMTVDELLLTKNLSPDVVLLDLHRHDGTEPAAQVRWLVARRYRVLVLGTRHDPGATTAAYAAGARGCVNTEQNLLDLAIAIRAVATGDLLRPPGSGHQALPGRQPQRPLLSDRERAVLVAYVSGMTLETAARHVGVRPDTAKTYLRRVKAKYQAAGRPAYTKVELARRVWEEHAPPA
jgi:DNA-binding NarL/FixJ family response regulator